MLPGPAAWVIRLAVEQPLRNIWTEIAVIATIFVATLIVCGIAYLHVGKPLPVICDEYANLLEADTFAHGRLTNPPHPMAEHFETLHVLQRPTYAGKFPPGLPLLLALGQVIWDPLLGSWISVAMGCAATCWMMLAWVPPRWAMLGSFLLALLPIVHTWEVSYFGGGLALFGGSLLCGAAVRALRQPSAMHGVIAAVGGWSLLNSRPFEGALLIGVLAAIAAYHVVTRKAMLRPLLRQSLLAAALAAVPMLGLNLYYNYRVTGSALTLPYTLHAQQYMYAPLMYWQSPHTPTREVGDPLKHFHSSVEFDEYAEQRTWSGWAYGVYAKICGLLEQYVAPLWMVPALLLSLLTLRRSQAARWAWGTWLMLPLLHFSMTPWLRWNYLAPIAGLIAVAIVYGLRVAWQIKIKRMPVGAIAACVIAGGIVFSSVRWAWAYDAVPEIPIVAFRQIVLDRLQQVGGEHLVIIGYDPNQISSIDIVYNAADIDGSPVVFARDLGPARNKEIIDYFPRRHVWIVDPGTARLRPYEN